MYKVLITTSGIGSRLGELTTYTNKSLVRVGKKPALSYIIEKYDKKIPLVITVGYFAKQVIEFCNLVYSDRNITFVEVDNFDGPGSSLGYSMLKAKKELQCPFIFHASDTLIDGNVESPENENWVAGYKMNDASQYASFIVQDECVSEFRSKGATDFDLIHIGLVGIKNYRMFWDGLDEAYAERKMDSSLNDISGLKKMLEKGEILKCKTVSKWYDIGNVKSLLNTRAELPDKFENLDKVDESIFLFEHFVVKFFYKTESITGRIKRAKVLRGLVPEITKSTNNFYMYKYAEGNMISEDINVDTFKKFLEWSKKDLLVPVECTDKAKFKEVCNKFYKTKTYERIEQFYKKHSFKDEEEIINGKKVPPIMEILERLDFDNWINEGVPSKFHGDLHFENIVKTEDSFVLIDWRQDFGGIHEYGDLYYDLAKLYHGIIVNHTIIKHNLFTIKSKDGQVYCDLLRPQMLVECEREFLNFLRYEGYDVKKVKALTALIYLNIAPLHHHPYDKFLYYFGKNMLHEVLNDETYNI